MEAQNDSLLKTNFKNFAFDPTMQLMECKC